MDEPKPALEPRPLDAAADGRRFLKRIGDGDREAFQAFYECYSPKVMVMVRRHGVVPQLAEELVQEVFVVVWLCARSYRDEIGHPERWLLGIARHKLQDHWRRLRGLARAMGPRAAEVPMETQMESTDLRLAMEEALAGLPAEQRRVLDLIYQGGLTFAEAAHALGVPAGTVKSRVHAALLTLRVFFTRSDAA